MHLLLTGAAGFVGRHVLAQFLAAGTSVSVLARREPIPDLAEQIRESGVDWMIIDLTNPATVEEDRLRLSAVTHVVHLAARTAKKAGVQIPLAQLLLDNVVAVAGLIERLPPSLNYMCYVSTLDVYGSPIRLPIDESHPTQPETPYGVSKLMAETLCQLMLTGRHVPFSIVRLAHVYGPGEAAYEKAIPVLIRKALSGGPIEVLGGGLDERDFVFVQDVAVGIQQVVAAQAQGIFNIASGKPVRILDVAEAIVRLVPGTVIELMPSDRPPRSLYFDIENARRAFGFAPTISIREGLAAEIAWFQAQMRSDAWRSSL